MDKPLVLVQEKRTRKRAAGRACALGVYVTKAQIDRRAESTP